MHITISFDLTKKQVPDISGLSVTPNAYGISEADIQNMLMNCPGYKKALSRGLLVAGTYTITDEDKITDLIHGIEHNTAKLQDYVPPALIIDNMSEPAKIASRYAREHKLNTRYCVFNSQLNYESAYAVCALSLLETLKEYDIKHILLIWDEQSDELPYFFEPSFQLERECGKQFVYVYSTKRQGFLTELNLKAVIKRYHDKVQAAQKLKADIDRKISYR